MLGLFTAGARARSCWSIGGEGTVVEALSADSHTRASAMEPEAAAWWWLTHAHDDDRREHRMMRLRTGLDLLVVRDISHRVAAGSHARSESTECAPTLTELAALAPPTSTSVALTYIEIVLVDEAGVPVAGECYEVELPDGRVCTGKLDADGLARVEGVPVGPCVVRFPNCHRAEVDAA